jgi:hypothetical protein
MPQVSHGERTSGNPNRPHAPGHVPAGEKAADAAPDLARVAAAWPTLAEPIPRAILALVESAGPDRLGARPARGVTGSTPPAGPDSCDRVRALSPDPDCVRLTEQAVGPVPDPGEVLLDRGHGCQCTGKSPAVRGDGSAGPGGAASSPRCRHRVANSPVAAKPSPTRSYAAPRASSPVRQRVGGPHPLIRGYPPSAQQIVCSGTSPCPPASPRS